MKMRKHILNIFISSCLALFITCCEQPYYEIPLDEEGNLIITEVSKSFCKGISTLEDEFTINVNFATASPGDVIKVECLNIQIKEGNEMLLPIVGTQKEITVDNELKAFITYTRSEAELHEVADFVVVTFAGETDSAEQLVELVQATSVSNPQVLGNEVNIMPIPDTAFFSVIVQTKSFDYSGNIDVKRKIGFNDSWKDIGSFAVTADVPVTGSDFGAGDTVYYSFIAKNDPYQDEIEKKIVVKEPQFFKENTAILKIEDEDSTKAGRNLLTNVPVEKNSSVAMIVIEVTDGSILLQGGSEWLSQGNVIEFVPSTNSMYEDNNSISAKTAFDAGAPVTSIDPMVNENVYIFKIVNGIELEDTYYGILKITEIVINNKYSVTFDYRIGDQYVHNEVII